MPHGPAGNVRRSKGSQRPILAPSCLSAPSSTVRWRILVSLRPCPPMGIGAARHEHGHKRNEGEDFHPPTHPSSPLSVARRNIASQIGYAEERGQKVRGLPF